MNRTEERRLPEHVTTPLLTLITARSLDEDYAHVARRRAEAGQSPPKRPQSRWITVGTVVVFGLLTSVVMAQTAREADTNELSRAALVGQIKEEQERVSALQADASALVDDIAALNARIDRAQTRSRNLSSQIRTLSIPTGFSSVHGEGVRITVDNAPTADETSEIRDEDLATLVDALWEAGAEAIAINGQRINALGGIRNTSRAVHVNGRPINPPYVVTAIGDNGTLQARLLEVSQGLEWFALVNTFGFRYSAENVDDVELPGARLNPLRHATEVTSPGPVGGKETTP